MDFFTIKEKKMLIVGIVDIKESVKKHVLE